MADTRGPGAGRDGGNTEAAGSVGCGHTSCCHLHARLSRVPCQVMEAHTADMRAVAVITGSRYQPHELRVADQVVHELSELSMLDLRRLFADREYPWDRQPELQLQTQPKVRNRRLMWEEEDAEETMPGAR